MYMNVFSRPAGTTWSPTWVSSGQAPLPITSALIDKFKTCVDSVAAIAVSSGSYYAVHQLPNTPGNYINEWVARIGSYNFVSRQMLRVFDLEVGP